MAVIGLYIAYATPVLLRRLNPDFVPGPWNLGRWSPLVGWVAVIWVGFIAVLFMLPQYSPVTRTSFNYAPVAVAVVALFALVSWFVYGKTHVMSQRRDMTDEPVTESGG